MNTGTYRLINVHVIFNVVGTYWYCFCFVFNFPKPSKQSESASFHADPGGLFLCADSDLKHWTTG